MKHIASRHTVIKLCFASFGNLARYPNIRGAHLTLAAVYSELGQTAEAQAEVAEVLRLNPKFSLEAHRLRMPIKNPAMLERHIAALRKAGLK
jgi:hypothetical protein